VDDRVAQFLVSVGKLCADARLGGVTMRLVLGNGEQVVGLAAPPAESDGADELDSTGYVDCVRVGGVTVPLSEVVEATIYLALPAGPPGPTADTTTALHDAVPPAGLRGPTKRIINSHADPSR
jgi:hypothetical protein